MCTTDGSCHTCNFPFPNLQCLYRMASAVRYCHIVPSSGKRSLGQEEEGVEVVVVLVDQSDGGEVERGINMYILEVILGEAVEKLKLLHKA